MIFLLIKLSLVASLLLCLFIFFLRHPHYIPFSLIVVILFPWKFITGRGIHITEGFVIFTLAVILLRGIKNNSFKLDFAGRVYLILMSTYVGYYILQLRHIFDATKFAFLTHILFTTLFIFTCYFSVYNSAIDRKSFINKFIGFSSLIYLSIFSYLSYLTFLVHKSGGFGVIGSFLTMENRLIRETGMKTGLIYIGNSNGKAWFLLIFGSFFIGYLIKKGIPKFLIVLLGSMPLLFSLASFSRGAALTSLVILIYICFLVTVELRKKPIFIVTTLISITLLLTIGISKASNTIYFEGIKFGLENKMKGGAAGRDHLALDAIIYSFKESLFMGQGFHFRTTVSPHVFIKAGFPSLAHHNTHNQFLSLLLDTGLPGLGLYLFFIFITLRNAQKLSKLNDNFYAPIGMGGKLMASAFFMSFVFSHNLEKNITTTVIYTMFFAIVNLSSVNYRKENEKMKTITLN